MPVHSAHLRRDYRLHVQIGAALALALVLVAFSIPTPPEAEAAVILTPEDPVTLVNVPISEITEPPPPPPPAPPPPVEVVDDAVITETIMDGFSIDDTAFAVPSTAPTPPLAPPPPPIIDATPPPPPVDDITEDIVEFMPIEDHPVLIGGLEGLQRRVVYPEVAQRVGASGTVHIRFVVDETGRVVDPEVVRSPNDALSEAALAAVLASEFEPGVQRGRPVKVRYTLPIRFILR